MPDWQTTFSSQLVAVVGARECLNLIVAARPVMEIPRLGTEWSARRFGDLFVVFAEWTIDDEVADG